MNVDFGFSAAPARSIDLDKPLFSEIELIFEKVPSLHRCISCGQCAAICTAGHFTKMQFYKINLKAHRGESEYLKELAEKCMLCGKCQLACPRGVNIRHGILLMSELS